MSGYCNYWIVYNILCIEWSFWSWVVVGVYIFYRYFMFFIEKYLLCELLVLDIEYLVLLKRNWIKWYSLGNINNSGIILNIFKFKNFRCICYLKVNCLKCLVFESL